MLDASIQRYIHRSGELCDSLGIDGRTNMITGAQVRGARAMLGWSARALATKADVPVFTVEWIEGDGQIAGKDRKALAAVQATLEAGGIEFLGGDAPGVRLGAEKRKRSEPTKLRRPIWG